MKRLLVQGSCLCGGRGAEDGGHAFGIVMVGGSVGVRKEASLPISVYSPVPGLDLRSSHFYEHFNKLGQLCKSVSHRVYLIERSQRGPSSHQDHAIVRIRVQELVQEALACKSTQVVCNL